MNQPPKPSLEYQVREEAGVMVQELTPQSDADYARWLRACNLAKIALHRAEKDETS